MALAVETHLGRYEILFALQAGAMGEVYNARDMRVGWTPAMPISFVVAGEQVP